MARPNLQGLNIVHPPQSRESDSQDLLTTIPFPDLTAQLDLWTNLAFESDEPTTKTDAPLSIPPSPPPQTVDLSFLEGYNLDPFSVPTTPQSPSINTSLAQILAQLSGPPFGVATPVTQQQPQQQLENSTTPPQAKRPRTRKSSVSTVDESGEYPENASSTAVSIAEDKRRRNTAASARFRLKKKEREAALEAKAKELEVKVIDLERECEGLRRENGWLKGLVVGVTGAAAQQPPNPNTATSFVGTKRSRDDPDEK